jgi:hypothetical protein
LWILERSQAGFLDNGFRREKPPIRPGGRRIDLLVFGTLTRVDTEGRLPLGEQGIRRLRSAAYGAPKALVLPKFGFHFVRGGLRNC